MSRKREHSVAGKDSRRKSKKQKLDVNCVDSIEDEDSVCSSNLQYEGGHDELLININAYQSSRCIPQHLIELMYQLDLSVLCSIRKSTYEYKYPSLSLAFEESGFGKFNNIVLRNQNKSIHIHVENVDKYYTDNAIGYSKLFTKEKGKRSFFINDYLNSFVQHLMSKSSSLSKKIKYLVIYTNAGLDLTEEIKLKQGRSYSFYPFKFDRMNMEECGILKDFLFTNDKEEGRGLYQFSQEGTAREEFFKRLEFSPPAQKVIEQKQFSQEKVKKIFLKKLVFAVNQPNREELNRIVKCEIKDCKVDRDNYVALQERILCDLTGPEKVGQGIIYEFNLLMSLLNDMFLDKNMRFINSNGKSQSDTSNNIVINYRDRITYLKTEITNSNSKIGYSQLFPCRTRTQERKSQFSINKYFTLFIQELEKYKNIRYFIIYTNADLDLTEERRLKKGKSKYFYPLEFDSLDIQKHRKYKILRHCACINEKGLYKFADEETTREKLLSLLSFPPSFQIENEKEIKEEFLKKLIFAVNQPNREKQTNNIKNEIDEDKRNESNEIPYNYEQLHEIALRWAESHEFGFISKGIMERLFEDIKYNRLSGQRIQNKNIDEEIKFAKSVVGTEGTPTFNEFLDFIIKGEGKKYLQVLKTQGMNLASVSSILNKAGTNAVKAFGELFALWFDVKGNKTHYLDTLEKEEVSLANMSSILNGSGANAAKAFKELFALWFNVDGNKTQYLTSLEKEGVSLGSMSGILNGTGANAANAFHELYALWFDVVKGNETQYLKILKKEGVSLANVSSILNGAGNNAAKAFKELYALWFNVNGNKTEYLEILEMEGVSLASMSCILSGAGVKASNAFVDLYFLWFDLNGDKTQYLKTLEKAGVSLASMSSVLSRSGVNAAKAFKKLYSLWFDAGGRKTQYLKILEEEGINLTNITSILHGAASKAPKAFKELYDLWFDEEGNKKKHLKHFIKKRNEEKCFTIHNLSGLLSGAGANVKDAFEKLHSVCFNKKGKRTRVLDDFYEADFEPSNLSSILCGAGARSSSVLKELHRNCFNEKGKRTELLDDFYRADFEPSNLSSALCRTGGRSSSILKELHSNCFDAEGKGTELLEDFHTAGFRSGDLCNILSGAAESLKKFHHFCFVGDTQIYLNHFLDEKEGFTLINLSDILHGARANICNAFKDFHDVCFDDKGKTTELFDDFYKAVLDRVI